MTVLLFLRSVLVISVLSGYLFPVPPLSAYFDSIVTEELCKPPEVASIQMEFRATTTIQPDRLRLNIHPTSPSITT